MTACNICESIVQKIFVFDSERSVTTCRLIHGAGFSYSADRGVTPDIISIL
jgi:hypothetical protein